MRRINRVMQLRRMRRRVTRVSERGEKVDKYEGRKVERRGIRSSLPSQEMRLELTSAFCLPSFLPQELDGKKGMFLLKPDRSRTDMTSSGSLFMQKNATIVRRLLGLNK